MQIRHATTTAVLTLSLLAVSGAVTPVSAGLSNSVVPAGTAITVRTISKIKPKDANAGDTFQATIDDPVVINGREIIPRGASAEIRLYKANSKGDDLALRLQSVRVRGRTVVVNSDFARVTPEKKGMGTGAKTAIGAGIGAAVGAIAGGGKGAAIGAGAGAGTGLIISKVKGRDTEIPAETRLTFTTRNALRV